MKKTKSIITLLLVVTMIAALCSCGAKEEAEPNSEVANPVHEATVEEVADATGITLAAPEGAENVVFSYIEAEETAPIAQVVFTLDGKEFCHRAQDTDLETLTDVDFESVAELQEALDSAVASAVELSGMNYEFSVVAGTLIKGNDAVVALNEGAEGVVCWLDGGHLYTLSVDANASQDLLEATAEKC